MNWMAEHVIWVAPLAVGGSVFLTVMALAWPRKIRVKFHNVPAPSTLAETIRDVNHDMVRLEAMKYRHGQEM